ncbi:hypothetical protein LPJ53_004997, partial [Coemansia erecta]
MHRYNKRKSSLPRRSPSYTAKDTAPLCTVKMSFVDDYLRDPSGYSRALNGHRMTPYDRRSPTPPSDPNGPSLPAAQPETPPPLPPALPMFEINVVREELPNVSQLEDQRKNLEVVFNRIFIQKTDKPTLPSRPRPNPIHASAGAVPAAAPSVVASTGDGVSGLEEFSDITCMKPSVSTCNVRWAK